jgi:hypothetical protein
MAMSGKFATSCLTALCVPMGAMVRDWNGVDLQARSRRASREQVARGCSASWGAVYRDYAWLEVLVSKVQSLGAESPQSGLGMS